MLSAAAKAEEPPSKRARVGPGTSAGKLWPVDPVWEAECIGRVRDGGVTAATLTRRLEAGGAHTAPPLFNRT